MDNGKSLYESTFIVNASLDDTQVESVIGRVQDTITRNGGTVAALNKWGRKRLAYSINKKTNGFYVNLEFEGPGPVIAALERAYQLDEMILRYLTLVLDKKALAARARAAAAAAVAAQPAELPAAVPTREPLFSEPSETKKG
jgi:small subunit ribosomal protein S6